MSAAGLAVQVRGARKRFGEREVLSGLDLDIGATEFVVMLGKSGSGKSTLLRALCALEPLDAGEARVPPRRSVVFQEPRLVESLRVRDNLLLGLPRTRAQLAAAEAALDEVELGGRSDAWPGTLSGGEAQRVALARALLRHPQLLLLDEPFAALDALTRIRMHALVARLCERHRTAVLLVTHDVDEAILLADRAVVLKEGQLGASFDVSLPRPRARGVPGFAALRRSLLAELGVVEQVGGSA